MLFVTPKISWSHRKTRQETKIFIKN